MKSFRGTGYAFSIGTAALLLAGCGSQASSGAPAALPLTLGAHSVPNTASYQQLYLFRPQTDGIAP